MMIKRKQDRRRVRVGVDTGGTFTDFLYHAAGRARIFKVPSTPDDPSRAITEGLRRVAGETGARLGDLEVVHGTTVGTNALLERRGARAALVTTEGFEGVLVIGGQARAVGAWIAGVHAGGSLRAGPESAGSGPGPACYGHSLLPTVTDANLVLGR